MSFFFFFFNVLFLFQYLIQNTLCLVVMSFYFPVTCEEMPFIVALMKGTVSPLYHFSSVSRVQLFVTPWTACSTPGFPVHHHLMELTQTHVHWVSDAIQPSHPLSSPFLPAFNLSQHQVFSSESVLHIKWPKYWSFSISPSNEYSGLISFRMDWLDLLAVQGTLESSSTPQFKSINSSVLSFLHSPTLTSIHDYWENRSFD